jgi:hypothetical protein
VAKFLHEILGMYLDTIYSAFIRDDASECVHRFYCGDDHTELEDELEDTMRPAAQPEMEDATWPAAQPDGDEFEDTTGSAAQPEVVVFEDAMDEFEGATRPAAQPDGDEFEDTTGPAADAMNEFEDVTQPAAQPEVDDTVAKEGEHMALDEVEDVVSEHTREGHQSFPWMMRWGQRLSQTWTSWSMRWRGRLGTAQDGYAQEEEDVERIVFLDTESMSDSGYSSGMDDPSLPYSTADLSSLPNNVDIVNSTSSPRRGPRRRWNL